MATRETVIKRDTDTDKWAITADMVAMEAETESVMAVVVMTTVMGGKTEYMEVLMGVKVTIPTPHAPKTDSGSSVSNRPTSLDVGWDKSGKAGFDGRMVRV